MRTALAEAPSSGLAKPLHEVMERELIALHAESRDHA